MTIMKKEYDSFYAGIVFLFLYRTIFQICERLVSTFVLSFQWNVYVVPVFLTLTAVSMIIIFIKMSSPSKINLVFFLTIIISFLLVSLFVPEKHLGHGRYSVEEVGVLNLRSVIDVFFTWIIVIIAYAKYRKMRKN